MTRTECCATFAFLVLLLPCAAGAERPGPDPARAVALYEAGRYDEARPVLEELAATGRADGPLWYRLFYCRNVVGDREGARVALARAEEALAAALDASRDLEVPFYLANTYRNLDRNAEARRVAAEATSRVESGEIAEPSAPIDVFRLAKLYEDQGRSNDATGWYRRALAAFEADPGEFPGNVRWALRYLAKDAFARARFAEAIEPLERLAAADPPSKADLDRLAVAYVRVGNWQGAVETWRRVEALDPATADRARYAWRLARMAQDLGSLPQSDPSGRPWSSLSKDELEAVLAEQSKVAVDARAPFEQASVSDDAALESARMALADAKAAFVAAAIEYTARNLPIRETAFVGGYAPLIFHPDRWEVPRP